MSDPRRNDAMKLWHLIVVFALMLHIAFLAITITKERHEMRRMAGEWVLE